MVYLYYQFFFFNGTFKPSISIAIVLLIVLALKTIVVELLQKYGKKYKSELMIEAAKESKADFISTCVVLLVLILAFFEEYIPSFINVDKIGSLGMSIYVFYTSIKMMIYNIKGMLINDEENNEIKQEIEEKLKEFKKLEFKKVKVIKMSSYYSIFIQVKADEHMSIKEYIETEKNLKARIKAANKLIRFIDIEPL